MAKKQHGYWPILCTFTFKRVDGFGFVIFQVMLDIFISNSDENHHDDA